jgi:hypothetical protein
MVSSSGCLQPALQSEVRSQLVVQSRVAADVMKVSPFLLDGAFPRLNRAKNIKTPELGQASQFETMSKVRTRNPKGWWSDGSTLGWIIQSF